jgi:flagellar assembly protein FliH
VKQSAAVVQMMSKSNKRDAVPWEPPFFGELPPEEPEYHLPTAAEIEAIEETARQAGYEAGFERGYQEGRELAKQEALELAQVTRERADRQLADTVSALEEVATLLSDPLVVAVDQLESELLLLITALARQVITAELTTREDLIQAVFRKALQELPTRQQTITVFLNPEDHAILQQYARSLPEAEKISCQPDPKITRGGCFIESGYSRVDASLETRLRQNIEAIWGELMPPTTSPNPTHEAS